uniref:Protein transport protein Sec31A n=1 Tax=Neogobius melanostomus TaxID=47308 RepID=A0A8C6T6Z4_9GOBI
MMKLKEINRTAMLSWSPAQHYPIHLASGTSAQQLDASFSTDASLEFFELNLADSSFDMKSCSTLPTSHRYHKLVWSPFGIDGQSLPSGFLIAGGENGNVILYDPAKIMTGDNDVVIAESDRHTGPVRALDVNPFQTNLVASGGNESEIYIWDLNNFGSPMTPGPKTQPLEDISCVAWNRQVQHILASSCPSGRTSVWDLRKNDLIIKVSDHSNRMHCSGLAWNPEVATQLVVASEDDRMPVIQMWDLRFATSPLKILENHTRGVLAIAWSSADPELLLSCGKDGRILCWNPNTAEVLFELPTGNQWCFDIQWCPRNPAVFSVAGFDGYINIYSIMGGTSQAPSQSNVDQISNSFSTIDPFGTGQTLPPLELPQSTTLPTTVNPLKKPPKWIRNPVGASFAFGGKLVSLANEKANPQPSSPYAIHVSQVVTETDLLKRSSQLQATLSAGQFVEFCQGKIDITGNEFEKTVWSFLKANFDSDSRTRFLELLGYKKEDLALKISAALTKKPSEQKIVQVKFPTPCDAQPVADPCFVSAADTSQAEFDLTFAAGLQQTATQERVFTLETRETQVADYTPANAFDYIASENLQPTMELESATLCEDTLEVNAEEKVRLAPDGFEQWDEEEIILEEEVTEPLTDLLTPSEDPLPDPCVEVLQAPSEETTTDPCVEVLQAPSEETTTDPCVEVLQAPSEETTTDPCVEVIQAPSEETLPDQGVEVLLAPSDETTTDPIVEVLQPPSEETLPDHGVEVPQVVEPCLNGEEVFKEPKDNASQVPADNASLCISQDVDGLITQALITGDFEGAVDLCLYDNRMADGIILALAGGTELLEKTQKKYFQKSQSKLNKLLSAVVMKDLHDILVTCELQNWKEALAAVMTYAQPQEFFPLCDLLGGRLEAANDVQLQAQACLCYICGGNVEKLVSCWTKAQEGNNPLVLQDLMEKVVVMQHAVEQTQNSGPTAIGILLAKNMSEYANLLASQGCLSTAITYLPDESNQLCVQQLRKRLIHALGQQDTSSHSVLSKEPPAAAKSNNPYSALNPTTTASAQLQYFQPARAASTVTSWSNQTPTAFPHVLTPVLSASDQSKVEPPNSYGILSTGTTAAAPSSAPPIYSHQYQTYPQVNQCPQVPRHYSSVAPPLAEHSATPHTPGFLSQYSQPVLSQIAYTPLPSSSQCPLFTSSSNPLFSTSSTSSLCPIPPSSVASLQHSGPESPGSCMQPQLSGVSGSQNGWNDPPTLMRAPKKLVPENYTPPPPITAPILSPLGVDLQAHHIPSGSPQFLGQIPHADQAPYSSMQQPLAPQAINPMDTVMPKTSTEGPPGAPTGDVIQPLQSMPAQKITKKPIPNEHLVLKTTFEGLIQKCLAVANDPQTKRKLDDANKRMEALYDKLREQTVSLIHSHVNLILFF